jgi:hypothetical protein
MKTAVRYALIALVIGGSGVAVGRYSGSFGDTAPRVWEATVYLPLADNRGKPFDLREWEAALGVIVARFGGATLGHEQEGCWLDGRQRVRREPVRPVVVSFEPRRLDEFRRTVGEVGRRLGQEAVYIRFDEPRVELIPVAAADPGGR